MKLETERHSGKCGHCHTEVPIEADVCTGCGARWGFSNGNNRQQQYDKFKPIYNMGKFFLFLSVCALLFTYFSPDWKVTGAIVSLFTLNFTFQYFFRGRTQVRTAIKGKLDWWVKK